MVYNSQLVIGQNNLSLCKIKIPSFEFHGQGGWWGVRLITDVCLSLLFPLLILLIWPTEFIQHRDITDH